MKCSLQNCVFLSSNCWISQIGLNLVSNNLVQIVAVSALVEYDLSMSLSTVPARLGKGQGAKEIGHNLARERPKFRHNLVHKRHKIGHSLEREWPSQAHFYAWTTKIQVTIQHTNETRSGHNFVGDQWKHGICKNFTSIFTSAVWKN